MTHTKYLICAVLIAGLTGACSSSGSNKTGGAGTTGSAGTGAAGTGAAGTGAAGTGAAGTGAAGTGAAGTGAAGTGAAGTGNTDGGAGSVGSGTMLVSAPGCGAIKMALVGTTLYWTETAKGTVNSIPTTGGTTTVVASGQMMPGPIAADATAVFWGNDGDKTIMKKPLPTGAAAVFGTAGAAAATKVLALMVDNGTLYIGRGVEAFKVPVAGGTPTQLMKSPILDNGFPAAFALDATHLFQTEDQHNAISREKLDGTQVGVLKDDGGTMALAPDRLAVSQGSLVKDAIAITNGYVIWADGTTIKAHPVGGNEFVTHIPLGVSAEFNSITGFVISGNSIYLGEGDNSKIEKLALTINPDGGSMTEATMIANAGGKNPGQLLADATSIYWKNDACAIMKLAK